MIVAFSTPAMGHLKPMLPILRSLVDRGQRVACFGHASFESVIRETGAEFMPYPAVAYDVDRPDFNLMRMAADLISAASVIAPALLPVVERMSPSLILQDPLAAWGGLIGTELGVPRVHTVTTILFNRETVSAMCREDGPAKLVRDVLLGVAPLAAATWRSRLSMTPSEAFGAPGSWRSIAPPLREIVVNMREVQDGVTDDAFPRDFVGPTMDPIEEGPSGFEPGYALVTFGTLSNTSTARFEAAMHAAVSKNLPVVALCGRKVDVARLRKVAEGLEAANPATWVRVVERVPLIDPVIRDARVVINHAGTGSVWEAARLRKPILFVPTIADQMVFATRLERLGIGLRLAKGRETDPGTIAARLGEVLALEPDWQELERRQAAAGGTEEAVRIVMECVGAKR